VIGRSILAALLVATIASARGRRKPLPHGRARRSRSCRSGDRQDERAARRRGRAASPVGAQCRNFIADAVRAETGADIAIVNSGRIRGDGVNYAMFPGGDVLVGPEAGNLLAAALAKWVIAKSEIAPAVEGRITAR
jgi:5'-nucleotidase-like protein